MRKIFVVILLVSVVVSAFPPAAPAFAQTTVIGRAVTRTERIAAAETRVANAIVSVTTAQVRVDAAAAIAAATAADPIAVASGNAAVAALLALQAQAEFHKASEELTAAYDNESNARKDIIDDILDMLDKVLLQTLKKRILDMMVDQIIVYIQGGGSPRFVTDWQGFMSDVAQGAVGEFAKELGLGFLCSPFSLQLRLTLLPVQRFDVKPFDCTLDKIVGNIQNFYDDFRNGGWVAFDSSLQMNNNYYGALLLAMDERDNMVAKAIHSAEQELGVGGGFISAKRCVDENGVEVPPETVEAQRRNVLNDKTGRLKLTCDIVTPGRTLGAAVEKAVGQDFDFIVNAQDLSAYIAAIVDALINRVIKEGFGLLGVSTPNGPQVGKGYGREVIVGKESFPPALRAANNQYSASQKDSSDSSVLDTKAGASSQNSSASAYGLDTILDEVEKANSARPTRPTIDALKTLEACQSQHNQTALAQATRAEWMALEQDHSEESMPGTSLTIWFVRKNLKTIAESPKDSTVSLLAQQELRRSVYDPYATVASALATKARIEGFSKTENARLAKINSDVAACKASR